MKTIKLPYQSTEKFQKKLNLLRKEYSIIVRYAFNRYHEDVKQKDIRALTKSLNNINNIDSWLIQCAIMEGNQLFKRFPNQHNIIFGGKRNFKLRVQNKITKEQFNQKRLLPLNIQGEMLKNGNRKFILDIIGNNCIIFKLNSKEHFDLELPNLRPNIKKELHKLEQLNELGDGYTYSIKLDEKYIYISFEEFKEQPTQLNPHRYLGIDMNPDTIGISIHESGEIIHAQEFSLKPIFDKILSENNSSDSKRMKYFQNKLKFESFEIAKSISLICLKYRVSNVFIESLNFKPKVSSSQKYNHIGNRKIRNLWKRVKFVQNLSKRLSILGIKIHEVNPAYSSFIGNLKHDYTDSINASIEIARRGYEYRILKNKNNFYPTLSVKHQWKEMVTEIKNWKQLFLKFKNSKIKYRVSLHETPKSFDVFRLNHSKKSCINLYRFR